MHIKIKQEQLLVWRSWIKKALFLILILSSQTIFSQTSGKLSGRVTDNEGNPLAGANVLVEGTSLGAAADIDGYYSIINLRAGTYSVRFRFIGFQSKLVEKIRISADQTTKINVSLASQSFQQEEVVVVATRPLVEVNQTSSVSSINKDEIKNLPVQGLTDIVNLQAGVVDGHFRGGRIGEVQYQVDGVTVNNPYDNSSTLQLDRSVIQEVQVISGTFDAKYGQAMSGVVNAVLQTGSQKFEWSGEIFTGSYYTTDADRYPHNDKYKPFTIQNYQGTISGPTYLPATTFFLSGRRFINNGYLYGERRFMPTDSNDLGKMNFHPTGDNALVAMQTHKEWSSQFKITNQSFKNIQISYQASLSKIDQTNYQYAYRYNPDGLGTAYTYSLTHGVSFTHTISEKMFYKLNIRQNLFDYKDYKYEDLFDSRYLEAGTPKGDANYENGAIVQGVELSRFKQRTNAFVVKGDYTWQASRSDLVEAGIETQNSEMLFGSPGYLLQTNVNGVEILLPRENVPRQPGVKTYYPKQLASYLQDRVEWGDLVVRAGLRFEYFDANAYVPGDLQNPANTISGAPVTAAKKTSVKLALAPRLGFSFPLTNTASLYFSYGHFYQMPGLSLLYNNADYSLLDELQAGGISYGVMGNPDLRPEKTIQYEFGLKQAFGPSIGAELTFFYKDIRDLLGVEFVNTYTAASYARYTNIDFGSVSGFTVSITHRDFGPVSATLDYTMQFAQGNSSDPSETATRAANGKDSRPRDIAFSWDQRHTLNLTSVYYVPDNFSISAIVRYASGQPYTPALGYGFGADLETNSGRKDGYSLVDLRGEKFLKFFGVDASIFLRVFNLFNTHFTNGTVFNTTGSPDYSLTPVTDKATLADPSRFAEPRRIEIGVSIRSK
jgi:outer membrane receptor protein involved in Fe transport